MENLNPTWMVSKAVVYNLKSGNSVRRSVHNACQNLESELETFLFQWAHNPETPLPPSLSEHQRSLIRLLSDGLNGSPILDAMIHFEAEVRSSCLRELESHIVKLPFLGMIPLLLFIGPAFLLLLIGPIMSQLLTDLSQ